MGRIEHLKSLYERSSENYGRAIDAMAQAALEVNEAKTPQERLDALNAANAAENAAQISGVQFEHQRSLYMDALAIELQVQQVATAQSQRAAANQQADYYRSQRGR